MVLRLAFFCSVFLQPLCMLGNGRGKQITCASERGGKARGEMGGERENEMGKLNWRQSCGSQCENG